MTINVPTDLPSSEGERAIHIIRARCDRLIIVILKRNHMSFRHMVSFNVIFLISTLKFLFFHREVNLVSFVTDVL